MKGKKSQYLTHTIQKINVKCIIDLGTEAKILKLLKENMLRKFSQPWNRKKFHIQDTKNTNHNRKKLINQTCIKIKIFFSLKDNIKEIKKQDAHWEKIIARYIPDKKLI